MARVRVPWWHAVRKEKEESMIPVQFRDPETEEVLDRRSAESVPAIGERVKIGFGDYQVLFRWQCVPTSCIVYVRQLPKEVRARAAA
jgi:hypothetical protein